MAVVHLKMTDAGAPQMTRTIGDLAQALRWALPQMGWTIEFERDGGNVTVFKSVANGFTNYFRIDDTHNADYAYMQAAETVTDVDTFNANAYTSDVFSGHAYSSGTRYYEVIGDEKSVVVWTIPQYDYALDRGWTPIYIGQLAQARPGDNTFLIAGTDSTTYYYQYWWSYFGYTGRGGSTSNNHLRFLHNYDGASTNIGGHPFVVSPALSGTQQALGVSGWETDGFGNHTYGPLRIHERAGRIRGMMRGLWAPLGNWIAAGLAGTVIQNADLGGLVPPHDIEFRAVCGYRGGSFYMSGLLADFDTANWLP